MRQLGWFAGLLYITDQWLLKIYPHFIDLDFKVV